MPKLHYAIRQPGKDDNTIFSLNDAGLCNVEFIFDIAHLLKVSFDAERDLGTFLVPCMCVNARVCMHLAAHLFPLLTEFPQASLLWYRIGQYQLSLK